MLKNYMYTKEEMDALIKSIVIIVDSREKANQHITDYFDKHGIKYIVKALNCGDYSFYIPANPELNIERDISFEKLVCIERKNSAEELSLCFTNTRTRFEDEFLRGTGIKKYLLVERCSYSDIVNGNYNSGYNSKGFLGSIHAFDHKYDLRTVFMPCKEHSPIFIYGVFYYFIKEHFKS